MDPAITESDFEALLRRSGIPLTADQLVSLREGYASMLPMFDLIRTPRDRAAEPAHVFAAEPRP